MSSKTEWFKDRAAECLSRARHASDPTVRAYLLDMAQKWLELSDLDGVRVFSPNEPQLSDRQRH
jgi:hypothetical protein